MTAALRQPVGVRRREFEPDAGRRLIAVRRRSLQRPVSAQNGARSASETSNLLDREAASPSAITTRRGPVSPPSKVVGTESAASHRSPFADQIAHRARIEFQLREARHRTECDERLLAQRHRPILIDLAQPDDALREPLGDGAIDGGRVLRITRAQGRRLATRPRLRRLVGNRCVSTSASSDFTFAASVRRAACACVRARDLRSTSSLASKPLNASGSNTRGCASRINSSARVASPAAIDLDRSPRDRPRRAAVRVPRAARCAETRV